MAMSGCVVLGTSQTDPVRRAGAVTARATFFQSQVSGVRELAEGAESGTQAAGRPMRRRLPHAEIFNTKNEM